MSDPNVYNVHDAKTNFSRLLGIAERGGEVVIAKAGKPVAKLVPFIPVQGKRTFGQLAGEISVPDDFDTLGEAEIEALFEGR